jgi:hypothetical protein
METAEMANYNTNHLQREIDSLRRQLMKEREESHYDVSVRLRTVTAEVEARILERCIVECMEEANAPTYTEEERIAILTATERLKEMRAERVNARDAMEAEKRQIQQKEMQNQLYQQMMHTKTRQYDEELRRHMNEHILRGVTATHVIMDEAGTVRWNKPMNPKEWLK